jgi:hypothetical protein
VDEPPPRTVQLTGTAAAHTSASGHLTVERVTKALRRDKRFLALVAILVVVPPVVTWRIPLPGAAIVGIAVVVGVVASVAGYKAIGEVIERTIRE